jgi:hypothetical protein
VIVVWTQQAQGADIMPLPIIGMTGARVQYALRTRLAPGKDMPRLSDETLIGLMEKGLGKGNTWEHKSW